MTAIEIRLACYGVLLAVIAGWLTYERSHLISEGEAKELAKEKASSDKMLAEAAVKIKAQTEQHAADIAANQVKLDASLKANSALSDALDSRVRAFDTYRRSHPDLSRPTSGSGPAGPGECGTQSCGDLASQSLQDSDDLARSVGELSALLKSAQRDRDALTGLPR